MPRTEWLKAWAERRRGLPLIYNGNEIADNAMNATLAPDSPRWYDAVAVGRRVAFRRRHMQSRRVGLCCLFSPPAPMNPRGLSTAEGGADCQNRVE